MGSDVQFIRPTDVFCMTADAWKECLKTLAENARAADEVTEWPTASWQAITQAGVLRSGIDGERDIIAHLTAREQLASACLTTAFILSQRDAAVRRIQASSNHRLRDDLLDPLACGERFATVGLSQLTTSRQHVQPALIARTTGDTWVFDGAI